MSEYVLTPCPPRKRCKVCEARLDHKFRDKPRASKAAKYRHQAEQWGRFAFHAVLAGDAIVAGACAARAATYAGMMWEEEAETALG